MTPYRKRGVSYAQPSATIGILARSAVICRHGVISTMRIGILDEEFAYELEDAFALYRYFSYVTRQRMVATASESIAEIGESSETVAEVLRIFFSSKSNSRASA